MKKLLCVAAVYLVVCLTACAPETVQDGTYTARYTQAENGFIEYLSVTFREGMPTDARFDAYSEEDPQVVKSELTAEEYPMQPQPSEWMPQLAANILKAGTNPDKIATVAGATNSSKHARALYNEILAAAQKGESGEILVENEAEK